MRAASACWALAALLCARACAADVDAAHATLVSAGLLDVAEHKYVVALDLNAASDAGVAADAAASSDSARRVVITDHVGTRFACELPEAGGVGDGVSQGEDDGDESSRARTVSELMDEISSACFYRVEGWWTFELCVRRHVRQFHQEKDAIVSEYVLGRYDEAATAARNAVDARAAAPEPGGVPRFHVHVFANGTACDLTGEPRSTEVRFVCAPPEAPALAGGGAVATAPGAAHFIESVAEPTTCHYVLTLATPLLCTHAAFRVAEAPVAHVRCRALPGSGDGSGGGSAAAAAVEPLAAHAAAPAASRDEL